MKQVIFGLCTFFLFLNSNAEAARTNQVSTNTEETSSNSFFSHVTPYLGFNAGASTKEAGVYSEGAPANIKLIGSYLFDNQKNIVDLGLGMSNQQFSNENSVERSVSGGVLEAAYRYQWDNKIQAGIVLNDLLNQGANYGAVQADAQFIGLQAIKELNISKNEIRLGAKAMTELNPKNRYHANLFLLEVQIGFGRPASATQVTNAPVAVVPPVAASEAASKTESEVKVSTTTVEILGNKVANFAPAKTALNAKDIKQLNKLALALKMKSDLFSKITVRGFADISGNEKVNMEISKQRAEAVAAVLSKNSGIKKEQIEVVAEGSANSKSVNASDRKVELDFNGIKNKEQLNKVITLIK